MTQEELKKVTKGEIKPYADNDREIKDSLSYDCKSKKSWAIFCCGGFPHISSLKFETYHRGGGWDLAHFALIRPDKICWLSDADLLTAEEYKEIKSLYGTEEQRRKLIYG